MTNNKRLLVWGLSFFPLIFVLVMLPSIPQTIPAHFGFSGEVTRYGHRLELLLTPGITIAMQLFWLLTEKAVMLQKESGTQNLKILFWCNIMITLVFATLTVWFVYLAIAGVEVLIESSFDFLRALSVGLSILWIVIGNLLPKCKQNRLVGIRTKWTLDSQSNWYKTHRFGGRLFLIYGFVSAAVCLFVLTGWAAFVFTNAGMLAVVIVVCCYSYHVARQSGKM